MISFFNGRTRTLGGATSEVFAKVDVAFRGYLHLLKGAYLGVFLAIALHGNEDGWAWPSYATLARETGYSEDTIRRALAHLCELEIDGHRVLLRYQPKGQEGTFQSNRYLLFPSAEEVARYGRQGVAHLGAETGGGFDDRGGKIPPRPPWWEKPSSENPTTKKNHDKPEDDDNDNGDRPSDDLPSPEQPIAGSRGEATQPGQPPKTRRPARRARPAPAGDDAVLGEVVRLYEAEIGAVTAGVRRRLLALTEEHGDLDVWQRAFDAVVGSNVRRLDYLESCLENDGQPAPKGVRASPAKRKRAGPRAGRRPSSAASTGRTGGLRGRVVSPEEMPQVEPEEPLPLP